VIFVIFVEEVGWQTERQIRVAVVLISFDLNMVEKVPASLLYLGAQMVQRMGTLVFSGYDVLAPIQMMGWYMVDCMEYVQILG
jgi:hypothetical protein